MILEAKRIYDVYTLRRTLSTCSAKDFIRTDPMIAEEAIRAFELLPKLVERVYERERAVDFMERTLGRAVEDASKIRSQLKIQVGKNELLETENIDLKNQLRDALERC